MLNRFKQFHLPLACCALICSLFLLVYRLPLDSDRLVFDDFFNSLYHGAAFRDWKLPPAPGYFPDLLLYWIATGLLKTAAARLFFVSVMQAVLCGSAAVLLARAVRPTLPDAARASIVVILGAFVVYSTRSELWLFLNSNNVHVGATLFGLLSAALAIGFVRTLRRGFLFSITLAGALATPSSAIYFVIVALPALILLTLFILVVRHNTDLRNRFVKLWTAIALGQVAGFLIHKLITFHDPLKYRLPMSPDSAGRSLSWLLKNLLALTTTPIDLFFLAMFAASVLLVCWHLLASLSLSPSNQPMSIAVPISSCLLALSIYTLSVFLIGGVTAIVSGGFDGSGALRYFGFPISLIFIQAIIIIDDRLPAFLLGLFSVLGSICLMILTLYTYGQLREASSGITPAAALRAGSGALPAKYLENEVAACVDRVDKTQVHMNEGISFYWLSRALTYRSPAHAMFPVMGNLVPMYWMMDTTPMKESAFPQRHYDFAVVQDASTGSDFSVKHAETLLPAGARIFECPNGKAQIWYYVGTQLDDLVKKNIKDFVSGPFFIK